MGHVLEFFQVAEIGVETRVGAQRKGVDIHQAGEPVGLVAQVRDFQRPCSRASCCCAETLYW